MSISVKFTKMHGLGNDFIFVDKKYLPADLDIKEITIFVSKRHIGIGCDQFILYEDKNTYIDMEIYNADGSKAEVCGNATCCLAYLFSKIKNDKQIMISAKGRNLECHITNSENVAVNMGEAKFEASWMPSYDDLAQELRPYLSASAEFLCVDMGNPHLVIIDQNLSEEDMKLLGPRLEKLPLFKAGVNVNFVTIIDDIILLKVWERGTGFTYACGSGACASFAASHKLGFIQNTAKVKFQLGILTMISSGKNIIMQGPVSLVAEGIFYYG